MRDRTERWLHAARLLHHLKASTGEPCACRTTMDTPAIATRLRSVEHCWGVSLPPSYRQFLLRYDGWPNVFRGASLLSTTQLLDPSWHHRAQTAIDRASAAHLPARHGRVETLDDSLIPIGLDSAGSIVFVLDMATADSAGETGAVAWISGLGIRVPSFAELLELIGELSTRVVQQSSMHLHTCAA